MYVKMFTIRIILHKGDLIFNHYSQWSGNISNISGIKYYFDHQNPDKRFYPDNKLILSICRCHVKPQVKTDEFKKRFQIDLTKLLTAWHEPCGTTLFTWERLGAEHLLCIGNFNTHFIQLRDVRLIVMENNIYLHEA